MSHPHELNRPVLHAFVIAKAIPADVNA